MDVRHRAYSGDHRVSENAVSHSAVTLPLFDPPSSFDRGALRARLRGLADENIWIGTSSWKYEGWLDQIYTRDRYLTRGKFSQKLFEAECVKEFAETFPT